MDNWLILVEQSKAKLLTVSYLDIQSPIQDFENLHKREKSILKLMVLTHMKIKQRDFNMHNKGCITREIGYITWSV
jgi:hypothetical protein